MSMYQDIYAVVKQIPRGSVASYGRIARMVKCTARQVGYAMAAAPPEENIPWHRVINSQGKISARKDGRGDARQKQKLLSEGVVFERGECVDFKRFGWLTTETESESEMESPADSAMVATQVELDWRLPHG